MNRIVEYIKRAFAFIKKIFRRIINGIINFLKDVVSWFKSLLLVQQRDIPFVADANQFKDMLKSAPVKKVGIFEGVYNLDTDEITYNQEIDADGVDAKTREILENEPLVVLN